MKLAAVIVAGGSGKRMGTQMPKQFLELAGKPILVHTVKRFLNFKSDLEIVVVLPAHEIPRWESMLLDFFSVEEQQRLSSCEGGKSRVHSVENGLFYLKEKNPQLDLVAIHDGVRPLIQHQHIAECFKTANESGASVCCVPVKASMRRKLKEGGSKAIDRSLYLEVQTPQTFKFDKILEAFANRPHDEFTDDASLYEAFIGKVNVSTGSYDNIKITTPDDLVIGERLLLNQGSTSMKPQSIKLILMDLDGTLTAGKSTYLDNHKEPVKEFDVKDELAIHRAQSRHGIVFGIISSGKKHQGVVEWANKLGIKYVYFGSSPKVDIAYSWMQELGCNWTEVAFVGDDYNDLPLLQKATISACPADAANRLKERVPYVLRSNGGAGCIREFVEDILNLDILN